MRRSRKPFTPSGVRGFESLPLRHLKLRAGARVHLPFLLPCCVGVAGPAVDLWRNRGGSKSYYQILRNTAAASAAPRGVRDSCVQASCSPSVKLVSGASRTLGARRRRRGVGDAQAGRVVVDLGTHSQVIGGRACRCCDTIPNRMLPALGANLHDLGPSAQRR